MAAAWKGDRHGADRQAGLRLLVSLDTSRLKVRVKGTGSGTIRPLAMQSVRSGTVVLVPADSFESLVEGQPECEDAPA